MRLAIISHTEHYINAQNQVVGWGPTIREINHLLEVFEEIWHVAVLHEGVAPESALPYASDRVHFVPIQPFGGPTFKDKLGVLWKAPSVIAAVRQVLHQVDCWQFRAPTGIGVFLIPWLSLFVRKPGWFKYAGNWGERNPPPGYRWQKLWLTHLQRHNVTINGHWPGQPIHCLSFENPCLTEKERLSGNILAKQKSFSGPLNLCFIGNLSHSKGVTTLVQAIALLPKDVVSILQIAGDGPARREIEVLIARNGLENTVQLLGFQSRQQLNKLYEDSHILVLPSASEGFPKVVAEAAAYGCVSLVSDVSAIGQYIVTGVNGHLLKERNPEAIASALLQLSADRAALKKMSLAAVQLTERFTYAHFLERIVADILPGKI